MELAVDLWTERWVCDKNMHSLIPLALEKTWSSVYSMKILMEEAFFFFSRSALFSFHSSFTPESCQVFCFSLKQLVFSNLPAGVTDTAELVCMYVLCFISSCQYFLLQQMLKKKSPTCRLNETKDGNCTLKIRFAPHFKASHKAQYPIPSCFEVCDFICFHGLHLNC